MVLVRMDVDALRGAVADLRTFFDRAMDEWTTVGNTAGRCLGDTSRLSSGLTTHLPVVAQLADDLEARVDLAVLVNTGADGNAPTGFAEYMLPGDVDSIEAVRQALGERRAIVAGREAAIELRDGEGIPDSELIEQIAAMQDDPYFASSFASQLTAEELAAILKRLSWKRTGDDGRISDDQLAAENAWYSKLVVAMSTTVGTATRATGDLALPPDYAQQWVDEMTAEVKVGLGPDSTGTPDHANALGLMLMYGTYSTPFLETVATGVYDHERLFIDGPPEEMWLSYGGQDPTGFYGIHDADGNLVNDPMAGVLAGLGNNAEAAQNFFRGGDQVTVKIDGVDLVFPERLRYLIEDRTWGHILTNGAALGEALVGATTVVRNGDETGRISAELASQTFALIGNKTGQGAHGPTTLVGMELPWISPPDSGWEMPDGLRVHVAEMLASYGADVYRIALRNEGDDLASRGWAGLGSEVHFPDDMPFGASLDLDHLTAIVHTLGQEQDDFAPFLAGVFQAGNLAIDTGLNRAMVKQPNAGRNFLTGRLTDDSNPSITNTSIVVGWAMSTGFEGDNAEEDLARQKAAAAAQALNMIIGMPFVSAIKPASLLWGVKQVATGTADTIRNSAPSEAATTYNDLDGQARDQLTASVMNLLLRNGYFSDFAIAGADQDGVEFTAPDPAAIVFAEDGVTPLAFNTDSTAYKRWSERSSMQSFVNESVIGVIADQWESAR